MKIKTLTGYLTATNKKHIKVMFDAGLKNAKLNRINYYIIPGDGFYTVNTAIKDSQYTSGFQTSKATFKLN